MKRQCKQQQDSLTDSEIRLLARGIEDECNGRGEQFQQHNNRLTTDLSEERLRARAVSPLQMLNIVF